MAGEQQIDHLLAGGLVEISGRLVGDQDGGIGRERAGERDALLLAAGKLRRIMLQPVGQSDLAELLARAGDGIGRAGKLQRHGDVLQRRHGRDQVEGLEHDADVAAAKARQRILVEAPQVRPGHHDRAAVRPFEAGQDHQQRGLAGAGRADQANRLAAPYIQGDILEDMDPGRGAAERKIDAGECDGRR